MQKETLPYQAEFLSHPAEKLVHFEQSKWQDFLGKPVRIPKPPNILFDMIDHLRKQEVTVFDPFYFFKPYFKKDARYPGWKTKPHRWYWSMKERLTVPTSDDEEGGYWGLFDRTTKPEYNKGKQMYMNDPFGLLLGQLRKEAKIQTPIWCRHIPEASRFGLSAQELEKHVYPAIAQFIDITDSQIFVRSPKTEEFNLLGNRSYPYLGKTYSLEWFSDRLNNQLCLIGGSSGYGSFADVYCLKSDYRYDSIGWRPVIIFTSSSKTPELY